MPKRSSNPELRVLLVTENRRMLQTLRDAITERAVRDKDYPQVAVACECGGHRAYGHSLKCHKSIRQPVSYVEPLLKALRPYGNPPEVKKVNGKVVFVGTCAEDSASNQVLEKNKAQTHAYPSLKDLEFTQPIRTRNYQWRAFCDVCKAIF